MSKFLFFFAIPLILTAGERVVVVEVATATWCPPCARAVRGINALAERYPGRVLIVENHSSDDFSNPSSRARNSYYDVSSIPTVYFDGVEKVVGSSRTNMFNTYNTKYILRTAHPPKLEIELEIAEHTPLSGELQATIINSGEEKISGKAHFTVTESDIQYTWQTEQELHFVQRAMLPYATGEPVELEPGEQVTLTRTYQIDAQWPNFSNVGNVEFGCFVQGTDREIFQGAVLRYGENGGDEDTALTGQAVDAVDSVQVDEDIADVGPRFRLELPGIADDEAELILEILRPAAIALYIYDQTGTQVKAPYRTERLAPGSYTLTIDTGDFAEGTYIVRATDGETIVQEAFRVDR